MYCDFDTYNNKHTDNKTRQLYNNYKNYKTIKDNL